jgi:hypothetical protein
MRIVVVVALISVQGRRNWYWARFAVYPDVPTTPLAMTDNAHVVVVNETPIGIACFFGEIRAE